MPFEKKFTRKKWTSVRIEEMSAMNVINNSKFFRTTSRRNSTSSVNMVNSTLINNFAMSNNLCSGHPRNSLAMPSQKPSGTHLLNGRRLSGTVNVRRCQSMRQSENGLYDPEGDMYDEETPQHKVTSNFGLSTRRASQVDGGYHSNGSLTSSDSYSSYTKFNWNKGDNPLSSIRINIVDEIALCLENVYKVCILGSHSVGKSSMIDAFRECQSEQMSPNNSKNFYHVSLYLSEMNNGQDLDDISIKTHSDSFEEAESIISYNSADVYLVMYAVNDRESFEEAKTILKEVSSNFDSKHRSIILVANKTDLVRSRLISMQESKQLAIDYGCKYVETSCTISHNINLLLAGIAALINPSISKANKNGKKSSFFRRLLKKANLNKSKSCHDLHVF